VDDARVPDLLRVEENVPDQQERNQTGFCGVGSSGAPDCATHQIQEVNNCTDSASSLKNLFEEFLVSQRQRNIETDQKLKKLEEYLFVILDHIVDLRIMTGKLVPKEEKEEKQDDKLKMAPAPKNIYCHYMPTGWQEAREICEERNQELVRINSVEDIQAVFDICGTDLHWWVEGRKASGQKFVYNDGTTIPANLFGPRQPDNYGGDETRVNLDKDTSRLNDVRLVAHPPDFFYPVFPVCQG